MIDEPPTLILTELLQFAADYVKIGLAALDLLI